MSIRNLLTRGSGDRAAESDAELKRVAGRKRFAMSYFDATLALIERWAQERTEDSNFYYDLTELNRLHLAHLVASLTGRPVSMIHPLFEELDNDTELRQTLASGIRRLATGSDIKIAFGRRIGWYVMARILNPGTIVETGVDLGVGSCVLCAALLRNAEGGHPGRYYGLDIRTDAGELLAEPYTRVGEILYGDSLESLAAFARPIDLFINDSDHSADYEFREYLMIADKLAAGAVILGDNSHVTDSLPRFCAQSGRPFVFFRETPKDHWYPGAGIGISYPSGSARDGSIAR